MNFFPYLLYKGGPERFSLFKIFSFILRYLLNIFPKGQKTGMSKIWCKPSRDNSFALNTYPLTDKIESMKVKCPICKKEIEWESSKYRPFCSERCYLIDLSKWLGGEYYIPDVERKRDKNDEKED
jgi:endogenous inhibitor of DNA gyrase (YacG/DUF329 family)